MDCIFCDIISGKCPAHITYETSQTLAFAPLPEDVASKAHMVIVPKRHYQDIYEMPPEELSHILNTTQTIANRLRERYGATGINLLHASGLVAQQSVSHFHIHLLPRYPQDNIDAWPKTGYKEAEYIRTYAEIKSILKQS